MTGIDAGVPAVTVDVPSATATFATTPWNVTRTEFCWPWTIVAVVVPAESRWPPPAAPSYSPMSNVTVPGFTASVTEQVVVQSAAWRWPAKATVTDLVPAET